MKKRILSLILALSMVLSVLPLGAFAAGSTQDLVIGSDGYPVGSEGGSKDCNGGGNGNDWEYYSKSRILCLNGGTFDLSTTEPVKCEIHSFATITDGTFNGAVYNLTETISGGIFNGTVTNDPTGKISGGTFAGSVENQGTIKNGSFEGQVTNDSNGEISGGTFQSTGSVTNEGTITGNGTFNGTVTNSRYIENGTFNGTVTNSRYIKNGTFNGTVTNNDTIFGGIFAGSVNNSEGCNIYGGVFNGKTGLDGVTVLISITVASGAKITEVNGVSADWKPYVVVTSFTETREVIITADTEIFSLNGYPIDGSPYSSSYPDTTDKKTVKFTELGVLDYEVVLNGAITHGGDLVMENGYPKASNGGTDKGTISCSGNGWSYDSGTKTLTLTDGTFDFNSTHPQGKTPGTSTTTPVACAIQSYATITGGIFAGSVTNDTEGMISGNGTFKGEVKNHNGTISGGKFEGTVINDVNGTISDGTFNKEVSNINGNISNGTFNETVTNDAGGTIYGGTFAGGVNNENDRIYGGVFNGNATLTNVTGLHSITVASGAKIKEVNDVSAVWDPYVVVTESTKNQVVTITADTEIFSLNGRLLGTGDHVNGNKNTVKFTMPDANVVLNGAITCTDLVMEKGWPEASNEGKISCSGTGWSYDHSTKTLTLTDGTFNLSSTAPVQCEILLDSENAEITGGTFEADVKNNDGGTISDGTFNGTVKNNGGKISSGTFNGTVQHGYGTISGGTFHEKVLNSHGEITGGTFAAGLSANNGAVTGGVFNGDAYITGVTGGHFIKWDDDYSKANPNAKIEKVNGVSANWAPYVVVTELTTATAKEVTITADTEIFSLNGQPIDESNYPNKNDKTTVTFTMPDDKDVVLNKAITSTDLVMENGWPKDSNGGKNPCKGDGWEYIKNEPTNGDMLLLTDGLFDFSTIARATAGSTLKMSRPMAICCF